MESEARTRHPGGTPLGYMPQLDGLRALAVVGVWFEHWGISQERGFRCVEWGRLAVWLFFVLSGFLITGILLKSKRDIEEGHQDLGRAAKVFYLRRLLRILPIYYITLVAAAIAVPAVRKAFWWHLTYTTDFWVVRHPHDFTAGVHFWTLAVEEQFYLIWPWIVLLVPRRKLVGVMLGLMFGSIAYRAVIELSGISPLSAIALPMPIFQNIDKFAMGGLIAVFRAQGQGADSSGERVLRRVGLWVGLPILIAFEVMRAMDPKFESAPVTLAFFSSAAGIFSAWLVAGASAGFGGVAGRLLSLRPLTSMGKISYGLYLFHMFALPVLQRAHVPLPPPQAIWTRFFIYAVATLAVGFASWHLIESPLNSLKRKFNYTADLVPAKAV